MAKLLTVTPRNNVTSSQRILLFADGVQIVPLLSGDMTNLVCVDDPRVGSGLRGLVLSKPAMCHQDDAAGMSQHIGPNSLTVACAMCNTCSTGKNLLSA